MLQRLLLALFCSFTFLSIAQNLNWQWGELTRSKGQLISIMTDQNQQFSTIHATNQLGSAGFQLTQFEQLNPVIGTRVKPVSPEGYGYYVQTLRATQQHLVFIADRNGKEMKLFAKTFDAEFNEGEAIEILQYTDPRPNSLPDFNILQSPNKAFFAAYYQIPGKRNGVDTYGYKIFDHALKEISAGEYSLPYDANLSSIEDYFLTDNGEFFIGVIELSAVENQGVRVRKAFKNLHVYQLNAEGIKDYTFDLEGKRISNFIMNAQHPERLTLFGIYSNSEWNGMQDGYFSVQLNLQTDTAMAVGFLPFSSELVLSEQRAAEQIRMQRRMDRRNEDPQLSRYEVRDIFTLPDGSYVGSIEKYDVYTSTNYNNQTGQRLTTNYYYYNDIVAFCIDTNGQLRWEHRIPKSQVSINDYGPYSSYASFTDSRSINFIFNDSRSNYDPTGVFNNSNQEVAQFSLSKQRNVGAWVQIDLQTGHLTRQISHERSTENILLVPKAFAFDYNSQGIFTYGILGPQEKFGYIHLQTSP
jgi:hypothetical protein